MSTLSLQQANFLLPEELLKELRTQIPRGEQSHVVAEAIEKELKRRKFQSALADSFGTWNQSSHPELKYGVNQFVRTLRNSSRRKRA